MIFKYLQFYLQRMNQKKITRVFNNSSEHTLFPVLTLIAQYYDDRSVLILKWENRSQPNQIYARLRVYSYQRSI